MSKNEFGPEPPWRRQSQKRWRAAAGVYVLGLVVVLGALAERRWGWIPVRARTDNSVEEAPVPRSPMHASLGGMSASWSEAAVARGWTAGSRTEGYALGAASGMDLIAPWAPTAVPADPAQAQPDELGPGLGDLKVMNLEVPDFKKFGKR